MRASLRDKYASKLEQNPLDYTLRPTMPQLHLYRWLSVVLITLVVALPVATHAQPNVDPPCMNNIHFPAVYAPRMCPELILDHLTSQGIASISALTFAPDGSLYFARPATNQIMRLRPDGQGFFNAPEVFIDHLPEAPNGLAYDLLTQTWYISTDTMIVAAHNQDSTAADQRIIVSGLPGGVGGWLGNIRIGPDRRLYVAKASSCDACLEDDPRRAALLSFALDGSDPRIVARGLRNSYDFDWGPAHTLYIIDDERSWTLAELNAIPFPPNVNIITDFGWPRCDAKGSPVMTIPGADASYCAQTTRPMVTFPPDSHPTGITFYHGAAFPEYEGKLFVALAGSWNGLTTAGYEIDVINLDGPSPALRREIPFSTRSTPDAALTETSFYPYHLTGLAVSPEGWLYAAISEGRIYRFRLRI